MDDYVVVSFSGGKDSTAMLLHMIEIGDRIDEVITADTGMEFPEMYSHISKVDEVLRAHGIKHTTLKADQSFEYKMLELPIESKKYGTHYGKGWPTSIVRWCTGEMKTKVINAYFKKLKSEYNIIHCVGLASDEVKRLERENNRDPSHRHPLVEWGWTEADCLQYCYDHGYDWNGLYRIFKRVSCWCCPLSSIGELRNLWAYRPELWSKLQEWDDIMLSRPTGTIQSGFKEHWTVRQLAERFEREEQARKNQTMLEAYL